MKVVINACYGGFSLSAKAIKRLAELEGKECFFFKTDYKGTFTPIDIEEAKGLLIVAYTIPNPESLPCDSRWNDLTNEERIEHNRQWEEVTLNARPSNRTDPNLIKVVEELGEDANGRCAKLKIIEIPDDVDWEIDEYDGFESIDEVHRSWR